MPSSRQEQLNLWMQITIINGLGWVFSVLIVSWLAKNLDRYLGSTYPTASIETVTRSVLWLLVGCFAGYTLGVFQIATPVMHNFRSKRWPLTAMLGMGLAYSSYAYLVVSQTQLNSLVFSLTFGVLLGGLVGWLQWLILRQHSSRAIWWIPINVIIWILGFISIFEISLGSLRAVSLIAASAITGATFLWLLRQPAPLKDAGI
ncbi:hypothetical protein TFLX_01720 [Thermoflexales bacterium]|nr:hypothetical protein TFLX_01720 [Thermoflexales bacterium]